MSELTKYGVWVQEPRTGDCPVCDSDSVGVRQSADRSSETRRCVDEGHEFETSATYLRTADPDHP